MDYKELLGSKEWKIRRREILNRDHNRCQRCNNYHHLKNFYYSTFSVSPRGEGLQIRISIDEEGLITNLKGFISYEFIEAVIFSDKALQTFALYNIINEDNSLCDIMGIFQVYGVERGQHELQQIRITSDYDVDLNDFSWRYIKGLHVHHEYYQLGKLPWEYPDEALTTLCWHCHESLHQDQDVEVYNENMHLLGHFTPCSRCSGAGWLPEFDHVEAGVCFKCRGAKYDELVV